MAVYKLFPYKDTTLYSQYPKMNTGIDPILQVSNLNFAMNTSPQVARSLVKFVNSEIAETLNGLVSGSQWDAYLKLFIATAQGIVEDSIIEVWPAAVSPTGSTWNNGTGTYLDQPLTTDGACWESPFFADGNVWPINTLTYSTGSWNATYSIPGGGAWYTSSNGTNYTLVTESFDVRTVKDINVKVTDNLNTWYSHSAITKVNNLPNQGFLIKWEDNIEFSPNKLVQPVMQYYSVDTNTIYPPQLEFKWRDYTWNTGSSTLTILNTLPAVVTLAQNPGYFYSGSINRFRINSRPEYPPQLWQTSSVYTQNYYLPTASYWAIKDLDTNEFVINFDNQFTQLNADVSGSYFDLNMNGLQTERYYTVLIKTTINNSTIVYNDNYSFKIING